MIKKLVIFTDLDGTLLDHYTYSWQAAVPALERLRQYHCPVILNSSKTRPEIQALRTKLNNADPFIVENGSAVCIPENYFATQAQDLTIKRFGPNRDDILKILDGLRKGYGYAFKSFHDMSINELVDITGLDEVSARMAKQRDASEPLIWRDTDARLHAFVSRLSSTGLAVIKGGRFYHVMGSVSKADSIEWLMNAYRAEYPQYDFLSVGLGDSFNDIPMLEAVDIPVLVKGMHGNDIVVKRDNLIRTQEPGPAGWNHAILDIIERELIKETAATD
jgi:mannosyl-3-phosphoglycerate phosphatase